MWTKKNGVLYYNTLNINYDSVAAFDLDNTIITTKSKLKFPKNENDWVFIDDIVSKINSLNNYLIVIFTNQKGLEDKLGLDKFKQKIMNIKKSFTQDIWVFIALEGDHYRKPLTGMWDLLNNILDNKIHTKKSFYVGDAAGRKNDHSNSDLYFAHNIGIKFVIPEDFIKIKPEDFNNKIVKPEDFNNYTNSEIENYINLENWFSSKKLKIKKDSSKSELILLVGLPGCGKSTFAKKYYDSYTYINQDTDKTKEKSNKKLLAAIKKKENIIIDNTNLDFDKRQEIIQLVNNDEYIVKIIVFDIPFKVCYHMMYYRVNTLHVNPISIIVYRTLMKKYNILNNENIHINIDEDVDVYRINKIYATKKDIKTIINYRFTL